MSKINLFFSAGRGAWLPVLALLGFSSATCVCLGQQSPASPTDASAPPAPAAGQPTSPPASANPPAAKPAGADATALDYFYNKKPQEGSAAAAAAQDKMRADDKTHALDALTGADSPLVLLR